MKIYTVTAKFFTPYFETEEDKEENQYILDGEEEIEDVEELNISFQIGAYSLGAGYTLAEEYMEKYFEKDTYEIVGINEIENFNLVNWPDDVYKFYEIKNAPEEDIISFDCKCGNKVKVLDGWTEISCIKCGQLISRDKVIGKDGKYILIEIKGQ